MNFESNISIHFLNKKGLNHKKVLLSVEVCFNYFWLGSLAATPTGTRIYDFHTMALKIKRIDMTVEQIITSN